MARQPFGVREINKALEAEGLAYRIHLNIAGGRYYYFHSGPFEIESIYVYRISDSYKSVEEVVNYVKEHHAQMEADVIPPSAFRGAIALCKGE